MNPSRGQASASTSLPDHPPPYCRVPSFRNEPGTRMPGRAISIPNAPKAQLRASSRSSRRALSKRYSSRYSDLDADASHNNFPRHRPEKPSNYGGSRSTKSPRRRNKVIVRVRTRSQFQGSSMTDIFPCDIEVISPVHYRGRRRRREPRKVASEPPSIPTSMPPKPSDFPKSNSLGFLCPGFAFPLIATPLHDGTFHIKGYSQDSNVISPCGLCPDSGSITRNLSPHSLGILPQKHCSNADGTGSEEANEVVVPKHTPNVIAEGPKSCHNMDAAGNGIERTDWACQSRFQKAVENATNTSHDPSDCCPQLDIPVGQEIDQLSQRCSKEEGHSQIIQESSREDDFTEHLKSSRRLAGFEDNRASTAEFHSVSPSITRRRSSNAERRLMNRASFSSEPSFTKRSLSSNSDETPKPSVTHVRRENNNKGVRCFDRHDPAIPPSSFRESMAQRLRQFGQLILREPSQMVDGTPELLFPNLSEGTERRRLARETPDEHSSDEASPLHEATSPASPVLGKDGRPDLSPKPPPPSRATKAVKSLAKAGMLSATNNLDCLAEASRQPTLGDSQALSPRSSGTRLEVPPNHPSSPISIESKENASSKQTSPARSFQRLSIEGQQSSPPKDDVELKTSGKETKDDPCLDRPRRWWDFRRTRSGTLHDKPTLTSSKKESNFEGQTSLSSVSAVGLSDREKKSDKKITFRNDNTGLQTRGSSSARLKMRKREKRHNGHGTMSSGSSHDPDDRGDIAGILKELQEHARRPRKRSDTG